MADEIERLNARLDWLEKTLVEGLEEIDAWGVKVDAQLASCPHGMPGPQYCSTCFNAQEKEEEQKEALKTIRDQLVSLTVEAKDRLDAVDDKIAGAWDAILNLAHRIDEVQR